MSLIILTIIGAPGEITSRIHALRPSGHRCAMIKIVPDDFIELPIKSGVLIPNNVD